jgi:hypothetical protein
LSPREAILALCGEAETIPLAGIEGAFIRRLSVADVDALQESKHYTITLFVSTICDAAGKPLFAEKDAAELKRMASHRFSAFTDQIVAFNRIDKDAVADAEKNSEETASAG